MREALRLLEERDQLRDLRLEELRGEIQKGINSGKATPLNIEDIKASGRKRLAAQQISWNLMPQLLKRPEAENDLEEIWWFIAQDSPDSADKFLDRIQDSCLALVDFPKIGASREELKAALRSQPVGNYLIFYFSLEDGVDIIRVLHGSRDMTRLF